MPSGYSSSVGRRPAAPGNAPSSTTGSRPAGARPAPRPPRPQAPPAAPDSMGNWQQGSYSGTPTAPQGAVPRPPQPGSPGPFSRRLEPNVDNNERGNWQ